VFTNLWHVASDEKALIPSLARLPSPTGTTMGRAERGVGGEGYLRGVPLKRPDSFFVGAGAGILPVLMKLSCQQAKYLSALTITAIGVTIGLISYR
jgi:hypothetical protein